MLYYVFLIQINHMMDKIPLPNSNPTNEDESSETEDDSVPVFNPQHPKVMYMLHF